MYVTNPNGGMIGSVALAGRVDARCCAPPCGIIGNPYGGCVRIIPKNVYSFNPQVSTAETIVLAKYVDATMWISGAIIVRVHAKNFPAGGPKIDVFVHNTSFGEEDPSVEFVEVGGSRGVVTINNGSAAAPCLMVSAPLTAPLAPQLRVTLVATQGPSAGAFGATISVDLIGRPS